jgi:hypothetical protein
MKRCVAILPPYIQLCRWCTQAMLGACCIGEFDIWFGWSIWGFLQSSGADFNQLSRQVVCDISLAPVFDNVPLQGVKGLDVLFLLCGFFATTTLVPALEGARGSLTQASACKTTGRNDVDLRSALPRVTLLAGCQARMGYKQPC